MRGDVLIQAGHEGRTIGNTGAEGPLGNEIDWTPVVANEATRILRKEGVNVIRVNADEIIGNRYEVKVAVFIHFDGDDPPCRSGASVGYNDSSDKPAASEWKQLYSKYWPFRWMDDNFTANLRGYYGYRYTYTQDSEFAIELGEIACLEQAKWLKPRLKWLGALLAHFLSKRIAKGNIPDPGEFDASVFDMEHVAPPWKAFYSGIELDAYSIPRRGLINPTLHRALGIAEEPYGEIIETRGHKFIEGRISWFGGSGDGHVASDETAALTGEILRNLPSEDYYCAMRWNYRGKKQFWVNRHLLIVNPNNNKSIIVRAIDWGPNTSTKRILDLSNKSLEYLNVETDDLLMCAFSNTNNSNKTVGPI